jgi:hypothetical protein
MLVDALEEDILEEIGGQRPERMGDTLAHVYFGVLVLCLEGKDSNDAVYRGLWFVCGCRQLCRSHLTLNSFARQPPPRFPPNASCFVSLIMALNLPP